MEWLKLVHVTCAALSILGFTARGVLMIKESPMLKARWLKIAPHVVDTLLLVSAVALAIQLHLSPGSSPWLMAKIIALVIYIGIGVVAFRIGRTKQIRIFAWLFAMTVFAYIVAVAATKSPLLVS